MLLALCLLSLQSPWPELRGVERSGRADDLRLPAALDLDRSRLWRRELPPGHSSPVLAGDGIFLTACRAGRVSTICCDASDGSIRWETPGPEVPPRAEGGRRVDPALLAASTPVTDGDGVFVWFPEFGLVGYELSGEERWRLPWPAFQGPYPGASSPTMAQGRLVHLFDHDLDSFLVAVDPQDGRVLWRTSRPQATHGFSSPTILGDLVVASGAHCVEAYDLRSGRELWSAEGMGWEPRATPVGGNGVVYVLSAAMTPSYLGKRVVTETWEQALVAWDGDGDGRLIEAELEDARIPGGFSMHDLDADGVLGPKEWGRLLVRVKADGGLFALRLGGTGDVTDTHVVWARRRGLPFTPTPLLVDDVLVLMRDNAVAIGLDASDGSERWSLRVDGMSSKVYSSPISIGGAVVSIDVGGTLAVLDPRDGRVVSTHDLDEEVWATPAVGREAFYVRSTEALHAFRLGEPPAEPFATAFVGVDVLPMDGRGRLRDQTVVVREGRVVRFGPRERTRLPRGTEVLADGPGSTIVPGLIDSWARVEDELELPRHLLAGVTTLRSVDGRPELLELRERVRRGELAGPHWLLGAPLVLPRHDLETAREVVEFAAATGYDFAGARFGTPVAVWRAAAVRARELGLPFAGVLPAGLSRVPRGELAPWTLDGLESLALVPDLAKLLAETEVPVTPLLASHASWIEASLHRAEWFLDATALRDVSPIVRQLWGPAAHALHRRLEARDAPAQVQLGRAMSRVVRTLEDAGVPLLAGSDALTSFIRPGEGLHAELRALRDAGLSPEEVLRAATAAPGRALAPLLGEPRGTVTLGGIADLVLIEGDPLEEMGRLARPVGTMVAGRWFPHAGLERELDAAEEVYASEERFMSLVVVRRPKGSTELAELLAGREMTELDLRESTVRRLIEILLDPRIGRRMDAEMLGEFADRRWGVR